MKDRLYHIGNNFTLQVGKCCHLVIVFTLCHFSPTAFTWIALPVHSTEWQQCGVPCHKGWDVVLGLGPWLFLRIKLWSLVLTLALAMVLKVKSLFVNIPVCHPSAGLFLRSLTYFMRLQIAFTIINSPLPSAIAGSNFCHKYGSVWLMTVVSRSNPYRARSKTCSETSEHSEESDIRSLTHSERDLARS